MIEVCVLGNSHGASLRRGWTLIRDGYSHLKLTFFCSPGKAMDGLRLKDGSLVAANPALARDLAMTSGGLEAVDIGRYDAFVSYGLSLVVPPLDRRLSQAVVRATLESVAERSMNLKLAADIRSVSQAPIYIGHVPQPAARPGAEPLANRLGYGELLAGLERAVRVPGAVLLPQPPQTFASGGATLYDYTQTAAKLRGAEPTGDEDRAHMNGEFGALWLKALFDQPQFAAARAA